MAYHQEEIGTFSRLMHVHNCWEVCEDSDHVILVLLACYSQRIHEGPIH